MDSRLVMQEVMRLIVEDVSKDPSTEDSHCSIPIPVKDCEREFVEGSGEDSKEGGRHNEPVPIHG